MSMICNSEANNNRAKLTCTGDALCYCFTAVYCRPLNVSTGFFVASAVSSLQTRKQNTWNPHITKDVRFLNKAVCLLRSIACCLIIGNVLSDLN